MIKYALICECDAEFEGWFPDSASFDKQKKAGQVQCPMCDSTNVAKAVMAPNLKKKAWIKKFSHYAKQENDPKKLQRF